MWLLDKDGAEVQKSEEIELGIALRITLLKCSHNYCLQTSPSILFTAPMMEIVSTY